MLHHIEINVRDLARSADFWGWFLSELGYREHQRWPEGRSWIQGSTYFVIVQVVAGHADASFNRRRVGLNHVAFHAASRAEVDCVTEKLRARGVAILYEDRHPHAGGKGSYAVFFEDPDRVKVELVAPDVGSVPVRELTTGRGAACEKVLRALPGWFGIESAIVEYVRRVEDMPCWVVERGGEVVGFLALELKSLSVAEIHVMGVKKELHGEGVGTSLVAAAESFARARGVHLLEVKTLGASHPDAGYARTRRFYERRGFLAVDELEGVWPGNPCLVMVKPLAVLGY